MIDNHRALLWMSRTTFALGFVFLLIVAYMMFWPVTAIEYFDDRIEVSPVVVKPGDLMNIHLRYEKYINTPAEIKITFVDTMFTDALSYVSVRRSGVYDHWGAVQVPAVLLSGKYYIVFSAAYHINPLRTVRKEMRSLSFDVVN